MHDIFLHLFFSPFGQNIYPPIICGHFSPVCPDNELLTPLLLTEKYNPHYEGSCITENVNPPLFYMGTERNGLFGMLRNKKAMRLLVSYGLQSKTYIFILCLLQKQ